MKHAVIKTGGKQYLVKEGQTLRVEKLVGDAESTHVFSDVLLLTDDKKTVVGNPTIEGKTVTATILRQGRAKKVSGTKYKPKVRYRVTYGHRQPFTELRIDTVAA